MDVLCCILAYFSLYISIVFSENCVTDSFYQHVIKNFDSIRFQGRWYAMSTNKFWIRSYFVPKNVQFEFNTLPDERISIQASASFVGPICDYVEGSGTILNKEISAIFQASFDTYYSLASQSNTYWVLGTDYNSYAVLFTCWRHLQDGTCDSTESYIWTLSRTRSGHTLADLAKINKVVPSVCISPRHFKLFQQNSNCDFHPSNFPNTFGMVSIFSTMILGFSGALIFFTYCLTKVSEDKRQMVTC